MTTAMATRTASDTLQAALRELDALPVSQPWASAQPPGIARLIHMTAPVVPREGPLADNLARIRALNPAWALTVYEDADLPRFIRTHFGEATLALFERINPGYGPARADLFRYLCVYRLGGLYLDIKSTTSRPLDSWLRDDDRFILSQWRNADEASPFDGWGLHPELSHVPGGEYQQWFVLASAGHPLLKAAITQVLHQIAQPGWWPPRHGRHGVLITTGPVVFTLAVHAELTQHPHRRMDVDGEGGVHYSGLPQGVSHIGMHGVHYALRTDPVLKLQGLQARAFDFTRALDQGWQATRREARRRVQRLKRGVLALLR